MIRFGLALALALVATSPRAAGSEPAFAKDLTLDGEHFVLLNTGKMNARVLFAKVTICDIANYAAPVRERASRLLVFRFTRPLSVSQMQQLFRGVVQGQSGYSDTQLNAFLALLPAAEAGSVLRLRSSATGNLDVFAENTKRGSVAAPQLAAVLWSRLGRREGPSVP